MVKPFEMQSLPPRALDMAQMASQQLMRAELANEHANRMNRQDAQQQLQQVNELEKAEFLGVHERGSRQDGGKGGKPSQQETDETPAEEKKAKLPNVGYAEEKLLDIEI